DDCRRAPGGSLPRRDRTEAFRNTPPPFLRYIPARASRLTPPNPSHAACDHLVQKSEPRAERYAGSRRRASHRARGEKVGLAPGRNVWAPTPLIAISAGRKLGAVGMNYPFDALVLTPDDVDLSKSPLAGHFSAETYVLGTFNPGFTRLPNGNLLM